MTNSVQELTLATHVCWKCIDGMREREKRERDEEVFVGVFLDVLILVSRKIHVFIMILFKYHNQLHFLGFNFLEIHFFLLWVSSIHVYIVVYALLSYICRVLLLYTFFRGVSCGQMKHTTYSNYSRCAGEWNAKGSSHYCQRNKIMFSRFIKQDDMRIQNILNYD